MMEACEKIIDLGFINETNEVADFTENSTLATLMQKFLKYEKNFVKQSTLANWDCAIQLHIAPALGRKRIKDVTECDIQDLIVHLCETGRKDGTGGLSVSTVRDIMCPLKLALDYAFRRRVIPKLNWEMIQYPRKHTPDKVVALSREQQQELIQYAYLNLNRKSAGVIIMLLTGLRIGELCGLQFKDISLINKTISVNKTVQRTYSKEKGKSKLVIDTPKSETSCREIPIPQMLINVLKQIINDKDKPDEYFLTGIKTPAEPRTYRQWFDRWTKSGGFNHIKLHSLRHTFAVRAIEIPEFDIKSLSEILGHKNVSFTLNVYGRANLQQKRKCMELMNDLL